MGLSETPQRYLLECEDCLAAPGVPCICTSREFDDCAHLEALELAAGANGEGEPSAKHTPGPWEIRRHPRALKVESHIGIHSPQNATVALMVVGGFFTDADAHLIAAAPELLQAVKHLLSCEPHTEEGCRLCSEARAAIAKAEGHR